MLKSCYTGFVLYGIVLYGDTSVYVFVFGYMCLDVLPVVFVLSCRTSDVSFPGLLRAMEAGLGQLSNCR